MPTRFNVILSDDLNQELDQAAQENGSNKSEILRKAITLYLAAREGKRRGLKIGLVEPETKKMDTEIIGL